MWCITNCVGRGFLGMRKVVQLAYFGFVVKADCNLEFLVCLGLNGSLEERFPYHLLVYNPVEGAHVQCVIN